MRVPESPAEAKGLKNPPTLSRTTKEETNEALERILAAREQYDKLSLREFSKLLFDREIYRSLDRKTGEQKPLHSGTLARWLQQAGMR